MDIIKHNEIRPLFHPNSFPSLGPANVRNDDSDYLVPAKKWFDEEFFPWHEEVVLELGTKEWKGNNDCDDKANGLKWLASVCNGKRKGDTPQGVAVGIAHYKVDKGGYHAINVAIVGKKKEIMFIEPQIAGWTELSRAELDSVHFIYF